MRYFFYNSISLAYLRKGGLEKDFRLQASKFYTLRELFSKNSGQDYT
jgi:hypothetical protein